nr:MAG TPA: hypothetical protein [Microviridae sp.]
MKRGDIMSFLGSAAGSIIGGIGEYYFILWEHFFYEKR